MLGLATDANLSEKKSLSKCVRHLEHFWDGARIYNSFNFQENKINAIARPFAHTHTHTRTLIYIYISSFFSSMKNSDLLKGLYDILVYDMLLEGLNLEFFFYTCFFTKCTLSTLLELEFGSIIPFSYIFMPYMSLSLYIYIYIYIYIYMYANLIQPVTTAQHSEGSDHWWTLSICFFVLSEHIYK